MIYYSLVNFAIPFLDGKLIAYILCDPLLLKMIIPLNNNFKT
jgi:hypothetical protein